MENYNCNSKQELSTKEGEYIRSFNPFLNSTIAGRTPKMYYKENKEQIKQYYEDNKEQIAERKNNITKIIKIRLKNEINNITKIIKI